MIPATHRKNYFKRSRTRSERYAYIEKRFLTIRESKIIQKTQDGLGIIAITNVPKVKEMRERLLPLGRKFMMLPDEIKAKYEHPYSLWSLGWSHGKEKLQGRPDFCKGFVLCKSVGECTV